ncbi:MAG: bifunctional [glutamine synthetase] adenylyltransferase/[glutamine synthetase]-adenylyl-L-tyrosine phosphorylase, partial [Kiloniellales bacterium]
MSQPFLSLPDAWPRAASPDRAALGLQHWAEQADRIEDPECARQVRELATDSAGRRLLEAVFGNSPFLTRCALADAPFFVRLVSHDPEPVLSQVMAGLKQELADNGDRASAMRELRRARRRVALLVALADIAGLWPLERVTGALSDFAETALSLALSHLLMRTATRGELVLSRPATPEQDCGYCVLAMGKLGARELNYSSDIDLIVIFDPAKVDYRGSRSPQEAFVRLTRDLVGLIEERTADGYVFRTDLRLRPDPGAMPVAISYGAAMAYYESMGQNWERAAMIKARPVAGDLALGREFLAELRPFVWRKHLDFWAIQDIHSIKRQINAHRGSGVIAVGGHNIKLGRGGIREIEFFAQTQQLIYGGREPALRTPRTTDALAALAAAKRINRGAARKLTAAYEFLRRLEHRLQMVDDQQTQSLPADAAGLEHLAVFMGYGTRAAFEAELIGHMRRVEAYYAELFEEAPSLSGPGNLVFTGGEPDPDTMATLTRLGFQDGAGVFNLVRGWHHGRFRATRSTRSRELLTELMPSLLQAFGATPNPDAALAKFHEFLAGLPAGVQLFSLLAANPTLLELLAEIMGGAPALAEHLSRNPGLLEAVLSSDFFGALPSRRRLDKSLTKALAQARDFQDVLDLSRRWAADRKFQVGVNLLRHTADVDYIGRTLSNIADSVLRGLLRPVREEFERAHGKLPGPGMAVVALGKLGAREMTVSSDLDLVFLYKVPEDVDESDG